MSNYIEYTVSGAVDYHESIKFFLSKDKLDGYIEIRPFELWCNIQLPYVKNILMLEFNRIIGRIPHITDDKNKDNKLYYKVELFSQNHLPFSYGRLDIKTFNLDEMMTILKNKDNNFNVEIHDSLIRKYCFCGKESNYTEQGFDLCDDHIDDV